MYKRLLALLLAAGLWAGGMSALPAQAAGRMPSPGTGYGLDFWDGFWDGGFWDDGLWDDEAGSPARTPAQRAYGSVGLLGWPSVLVSVYLDEEGGEAWSEEDIAQSRRTLATAMEWIAGQCAAYGVEPGIRYDDGTPESGLCRRQTYRGRFAGGEDSNESDAFLDAADGLCAALDTEDLHRQYGTSSVGFLFFLPVSGSDFTMVHYGEDGDDYYYEYSCLYRYDAYLPPQTPDTPAACAHEILHLYGAPDLYEDSSDAYVTPELAGYVAEQWPDAIMRGIYPTLDTAALDRIDKTLCPLTAFRLGLCAAWPGQEQFPHTALAPAGAFAQGPLDWDGGAVAV